MLAFRTAAPLCEPECQIMHDHSFQILKLSRGDGVDPINLPRAQGVTPSEHGEDFLGSYADMVVKWTEQRVYQDVVQGDRVGPLEVEYERTVQVRLYTSARILIASGVRRQYQKLLQAMWPDLASRPTYTEYRAKIFAALVHPSFRSKFRENLRDVTIAEVAVGGIRNALLKAPTADVASVLALVEAKEKRLKRYTAEPRIDNIEALSVTESGGLSIRGLSSDPLDALGAVTNSLFAVGLLETPHG